MKSYDVAFKVDDKTFETCKKYGIDFSDANGVANSANLPIPEVYVINKKNTIVYKYFDADYRKCSFVENILDLL